MTPQEFWTIIEKFENQLYTTANTIENYATLHVEPERRKWFREQARTMVNLADTIGHRSKICLTHLKTEPYLPQSAKARDWEDLGPIDNT